MNKKGHVDQPILTSLLDTDFYKFLMLQLIYNEYPEVNVQFSLLDRDGAAEIGKEIDEKELREQLDYARELRFTKKEILWLSETVFYNQKDVFRLQFLEWLKNFRLPEYQLTSFQKNYRLDFSGLWMEVSMWEIPALSIISTLRARARMKVMGLPSQELIYAQARLNLLQKICRLKKLKDLRIADFGTRRRHDFDWQHWCVQTLKENIGEGFIGTSNVFLAMQEGLTAIGTNGHELPMVLAALAADDKALRKAPYLMLDAWRKYYAGDLLIVLPDAFGTRSFLDMAPKNIAEWRGFRVDSGCPFQAGEQILAWWHEQVVNAKEKLLIFSDNLNIQRIEKIYKSFNGRVGMVFGWGTDLTNGFEGCFPTSNNRKKPSSLICKPVRANGKQVVKLSDDPDKSTGEEQEIKHYMHVFKAF